MTSISLGMMETQNYLWITGLTMVKRMNLGMKWLNFNNIQEGIMLIETEQILNLHSEGRGLKTIEWHWKEIIIIMIDLRSNKII